MRKKLFLFFGLILIAILTVTAPLAWSETAKFLGEDVEILPLKDIKPGMIGHGLSVFDESQRVERFEVKIETISFYVKNKYIIWTKAWGGPNNIVSRAGIIAGMSGSPIYLKDPKDNQWKLIGALAYGHNLQPPSEALAGITPIEEMLGLQNLGSAYYSKSAEASGFLLNLKDIRIPLLITGSKKALEVFKSEMKPQLPFDFLEQKNLKSGTNYGQPTYAVNALRAGDAISAVLSIGDLSLMATGTVTLANSKGFLAFGHPFLWTGYSNIPVFKAEIGMVVPNLIASFKEVSRIVEPQLGLIVIDSLEGILGLWSNKNTMLPVNINFSKTYLNQVKIRDSWNIKIAQKNPLSSQMFFYSIVYPIILGSPDLNNLGFDIKVDFTYEEGGAEQTLSIPKNFFSKTPAEIIPKTIILTGVYTLLEKARKNLTKIDINIELTQEKTEVPNLNLVSVELAKTHVKPEEEISMGLMLSDKEKNYSRVLTLKAPGFNGEIRIKIKDTNSQLKNLVSEALNEPSKIDRVIDFIKTFGSKKNVFYVEIQHVKSIAERRGLDNKGWQEASKKTEEIINKEIREIELPEIKEKFNVEISAERTVYVKDNAKQKTSEESDEPDEKTPKEVKLNTIKFKPRLFFNYPYSGIFLDHKTKVRPNFFGVDVGLLKYKRLMMLNFGLGIDSWKNNPEFYGKFAPIKINLWKNWYAETNVAVNTKGKLLIGLSLSLKIF